VYGDAKGNVAWWATGKLYKQKVYLYFRWRLGQDDITEFLDFSKSFSRKSQWGYVYSANNQPEPVDIILIQATICLKIEQKKLHNLDSKSNWDKSG
jgi:penicillin amidase